jgi:hypothetical protein
LQFDGQWRGGIDARRGRNRPTTPLGRQDVSLPVKQEDRRSDLGGPKPAGPPGAAAPWFARSWRHYYREGSGCGQSAATEVLLSIGSRSVISIAISAGTVAVAQSEEIHAALAPLVQC